MYRIQQDASRVRQGKLRLSKQASTTCRPREHGYSHTCKMSRGYQPYRSGRRRDHILCTSKTARHRWLLAREFSRRARLPDTEGCWHAKSCAEGLQNAEGRERRTVEQIRGTAHQQIKVLKVVREELQSRFEGLPISTCTEKQAIGIQVPMLRDLLYVITTIRD